MYGFPGETAEQIENTAKFAKSLELDYATFFLATPLKALADYVYAHRYNWTTAAPIVGSLRVDESTLAGLTADMFNDVLPAYKAGRVHRFLTGFRKALKL